MQTIDLVRSNIEIECQNRIFLMDNGSSISILKMGVSDVKILKPNVNMTSITDGALRLTGKQRYNLRMENKSFLRI